MVISYKVFIDRQQHFRQWWDSDMLFHSYIEMPSTFAMKGSLKSPEESSLGIQCLKRKTFISLFWLLKTICNLKHLKIPLNNFLNLVLLCNENKLEERRVRSKGFWGTIIIFSLEFHVSSQKTLVEMVREILRLLYVLYLICACHLVYYILTLTISLLFLF